VPSLLHIELLLGAMLLFGSCIWLATGLCALLFRARKPPKARQMFRTLPPVTLLKPVCGLEKNLLENLRTACEQYYLDYQVLLSVQRRDDPAIPLLRELQQTFGDARVTLAIESVSVGLNGKVNNLAGALPHVRHPILVLSDSDVRLRPDYLRTIVPPLADPEIGGVSTFFRASDAGPWYEQMELLTINADHFAIAIFADVIKVVDFCFGASFALRRSTLDSIGGLDVLGSYLVEDTEMGRRILAAGKKLAVVPYVVETMVDVRSAQHFWQRMTYWDQKTRAAIPGVFAASLLLRTVPLALVYASLRGFDRTGLCVLAAVTGARLLAVASVFGVALRDSRSLRWLWLLPLKDVLSVLWFVRAFLQRTMTWRGVRMQLSPDGRLLPLTQERAT